MSWFEKLKNFVNVNIDVHDLLNINSNNNSEKIEYDEGQRTLNINLAKLNPDEIREIKPIINAAPQESNKILLEKNSKKELENILRIESFKDVKSLLSYFKDKIPSEDWDALRAAMHIRKRFEDGTSTYKEIFKMKGDVMKKYGTRGKNICNLCTSGYFESMLKPLHEEMKKLPDFSNEKYLKIFNVIINEEAFAIFIPGSMSSDEAKYLIEVKINRNLRYGVNFVSIHGIGKQNVDKIKEIITNLTEEHPSFTKSIEESGNIINVKVWFS